MKYKCDNFRYEALNSLFLHYVVIKYVFNFISK